MKKKRKSNGKVGYAAMVLDYNANRDGERPQSFSARPLTDESQYTVVQTKKKPRKP